MAENTVGSGDVNYNFLHNGKEIMMRRSMVTAERLGRYFNFMPSSICIKEEFGNRVEFPNENGKFNFVAFDDGASFEVVGEEPSSSAGHASLFDSPGTNNAFSTIASRPWALNASRMSGGAGPSGQNNKGSLKAKATIKVVFAELSPTGKPVVNHSRTKQTFVPIYNEDNANAHYLLSTVEANLKETNLMLVTNNGYEYTDEPGTRGVAFWKTGSRKIFAVKKPSRVKKHRSSADSVNVISSSDEYASDDQERSRKQRKTGATAKLSKIEGKLTELQDVVNENKSELLKVLTFSKDNKVPLALKNIVKESFSCKICHKAPMDTPILASRCCGTIIGCEACVQTWYGTGNSVFDKCCPNCRAERGYSNTFRLLGIDEFLVKLRQLVQDNESHE